MFNLIPVLNNIHYKTAAVSPNTPLRCHFTSAESATASFVAGLKLYSWIFTAVSHRQLQVSGIFRRETLRKARHPGQTGPHYSLTKYRLALEWSEAMLAKKANLNRRGLRFKAEVRHFCVVTEWRQMAIPGYKRGIFVPTALPSSLMPTIQRESVFCIERYRQIETDRTTDRWGLRDASAGRRRSNH